MKRFEWFVVAIFIGFGIMSMAVCGTFYKMRQAGFWLAYAKTLLEVVIWIGIPILLIYFIIWVYRKVKK